ncbi:MAG TPA: class I SAM-dependent methyltransferase [Desulfobacteraceae bacterium]|nr:class I SAM-dependent methyltransferase [Desulfobacteraceae bacterium]
MLTIDLKKFQPQKGDLILDAGCGEGRHTFALNRAGCTVFALDFDHQCVAKSQYVFREMVKQGTANGPALFLQGDTLQLPFRDATFDRIICAEVMEHIPDDRRVVAELFRVLKPGGVLAVTVPTPFTEHIYKHLSWKYFHTPGGHIRMYQPKQLFNLLTSGGLRIYAITFAHAFHSFYWVLRCLSGLDNEEAGLPKLYHRFLHRVVLDNRLKRWEKSCNHLFPKSMVVYTQKPY